MKAPIIITATLFLASCSQASADTYDPWNTPAAESCGLHLAGNNYTCACGCTGDTAYSISANDWPWPMGICKYSLGTYQDYTRGATCLLFNGPCPKTAHSHFQLINEDGQEACTTLGVHTVRCHGCDHVVSLADYGCQWIQ